jgi:hypothetical protein
MGTVTIRYPRLQSSTTVTYRQHRTTRTDTKPVNRLHHPLPQTNLSTRLAIEWSPAATIEIALKKINDSGFPL